MGKNKKKVIILGGQGNGTVIASVIEDIIDREGGWEILGYLNDFEQKGTMFNGLPVLDTIENIKKYDHNDCFFVFTILRAKKASERKIKIAELDVDIKRFATFVHPSASVSRYSHLEHGVVIMPNAVLSPNVSIGNHTHIYANALVGHDTKVGDFCFIANSASVGSRVVMEEGVHIGSNSSIIENVTLGKWSVIGLGAVVLKDVNPCAKMVGNPARMIGEVNV